MASERMRRIDHAIREVIGDAVAVDIKDPRVGFITVTDVSTSPDLTQARVYVSVLGDATQREDSMAGLQSAHGFLQARVASELRLKRTGGGRRPVRHRPSAGAGASPRPRPPVSPRDLPGARSPRERGPGGVGVAVAAGSGGGDRRLGTDGLGDC